MDEEALYCTSRDRVTSFEEGSPYCSIIGINYLLFLFTNKCFHSRVSSKSKALNL